MHTAWAVKRWADDEAFSRKASHSVALDGNMEPTFAWWFT
jgi:hypothetical protein